MFETLTCKASTYRSFRLIWGILVLTHVLFGSSVYAAQNCSKSTVIPVIAAEQQFERIAIRLRDKLAGSDIFCGMTPEIWIADKRRIMANIRASQKYDKSFPRSIHVTLFIASLTGWQDKRGRYRWLKYSSLRMIAPVQAKRVHLFHRASDDATWRRWAELGATFSLGSDDGTRTQSVRILRAAQKVLSRRSSDRRSVLCSNQEITCKIDRHPYAPFNELRDNLTDAYFWFSELLPNIPSYSGDRDKLSELKIMELGQEMLKMLNEPLQQLYVPADIDTREMTSQPNQVVRSVAPIQFLIGNKDTIETMTRGGVEILQNMLVFETPYFDSRHSSLIAQKLAELIKEIPAFEALTKDLIAGLNQ